MHRIFTGSVTDFDVLAACGAFGMSTMILPAPDAVSAHSTADNQDKSEQPPSIGQQKQAEPNIDVVQNTVEVDRCPTKLRAVPESGQGSSEDCASASGEGVAGAVDEATPAAPAGVPQAGQNLVPSGNSAPHLVQNIFSPPLSFITI